ncbi:MAG TPA: hypothetical protein RMH99_10225, partial [Sandaracinaceae bacterium LLY-WYZ-13_1]|nr:hypothetical protein [Sandaracinaceae bacterium LLY-WYZ-13_1]
MPRALASVALALGLVAASGRAAHAQGAPLRIEAAHRPVEARYVDALAGTWAAGGVGAASGAALGVGV